VGHSGNVRGDPSLQVRRRQCERGRECSSMLSICVRQRVNVRPEVEFRTFQANLISKDQRAISNSSDMADYAYLALRSRGMHATLS
jgi:hypothetical protein